MSYRIVGTWVTTGRASLESGETYATIVGDIPACGNTYEGRKMSDTCMDATMKKMEQRMDRRLNKGFLEQQSNWLFPV